MIHRKTLQTILLTTLLSAIVQTGCKQTPATSPSATASPTPASIQSGAIETEIVTQQSIAGVIPATGKIFLSEARGHKPED